MAQNGKDAGTPPPAGFDQAIGVKVAAGDYVGAARLAYAASEPRRAIQLYERVWRFADALEIAEELGEPALAVRLALDAGLADKVLALTRALRDDDRGNLLAVADVLAARGRPLEAAALCERAGADARAADLYKRGGALLEAARALVRAGAWPEAGRLCEELVRMAGAQGDKLLAAQASLELGSLCARLGRPQEAARALQAATREPATRLPALGELGKALGALGLGYAALAIAEQVAAEVQAGAPPPALPARADEPPAPALPRFSDLALIGGGRLGRVFRATDRLQGDTVVLKLLGVGAGGGRTEERAFRQFLREAEASSRLRHPNIVRLYDIDERAGLLVLEYLPGGTLADRLLGGAVLPPAAVRRLAIDVLMALAAAHRAGIVHRDVKPANIFLDAAGNAKLADFGAAHLADFGGTQTAGFIGTLGYLAPEQIAGASIGPAADLYALGVTLFEALTGQLPFAGPDIAGQHLGETPPLASALAPHLSAAHDEVLARALVKDPAGRFTSAEAMAEAVRAWPAELALPERLSDPGRAPRTATPGPLVPKEPEGTPHPDEWLAETAAGQLYCRIDARLGQPVLVELLPAEMDAEGATRLGQLAAAGGPHIQRVLRLEDGRAIVYERPPGALTHNAALSPDEAALLAPAWAALGPCGIDPTDDHPIVRTAGGPVILVVAAGRQAYSGLS